MSLNVILFSHATPEIKVSIEAYFEGETLVIDGYDIGGRVEEYWGDSDYEYITKVPPESVKLLAGHLGVSERHSEVLNALAKKFNTNSCYSDLQKFMEDRKIPYEGFSWA